MLTLRDGIVELYKKVATSIPKDIEDALKKALSSETDPYAQESLNKILSNIINARTTPRLVCKDSGFPVFFVKVPKGLSHQHIKEVIIEATRMATVKIPLTPNAVDIITGQNSGDNIGEYFPLIYLEETEEHSLIIDLMLRGGNCENLGFTYNLPTQLHFEGHRDRKHNTLFAEQDFTGVTNCVLSTVIKAHGKGCPPYTIGIALGGARDQVAFLAKKQLLRKINDTHSNTVIAQLEDSLLKEVNSLHEHIIGFQGKIVAIGAKVGLAHRHPESYFVDVSLSCWANRRGRLIW